MSADDHAHHRIGYHSAPLAGVHWFAPTVVHLHPHDGSTHEGAQAGGSISSGGATHPLTHSDTVVYNSRKARKGRYQPHAHRVHHAGLADVLRAREGQIPSSTAQKEESSGRDLARSPSLAPSFLGLASVRAKRPGQSRIKPHLDADVSFWIAVAFTLGSAVWCVNGFLVLLPLYMDSLDATTYFKAAAATAFVGGTIFEVGSYLMVVEALNRGRESNFGSTLYHLVHVDSTRSESTGSHDKPTTTHRDSSSERTVQGEDGEVEKGNQGQRGWLRDAKPEERGFVWWGKGLWHDIGYVAAFVQLCAATIFWVATITGLPGVISGFPDDPPLAITDVFFWTPQVVGGSGFVLSSLLLMLEVQRRWYCPALKDIGWHIGFWNLVGAVGFMICGAFGYSSAERWVEQSAISTFWGSWAFLIGSVMQLYEVIWREPPKKD